MARPAKQTDEHRGRHLTVRLTPAEKAVVDAAVTASGLPRSEYVRQAVLSGRVVLRRTTVADPAGPSVRGFLYAFLFSVAGGVTVSACRWLLLDGFHRLTGVERPNLDLRLLEERFRAFERVVEYHYRYHEFYGGMFIAACFSYGIWRVQRGGAGMRAADAFFIVIEAVFVVASRDALRNYYGRAARVLGTVQSEVLDDERSRQSREGATGGERPTIGEGADEAENGFDEPNWKEGDD